MKRIIFT